MQAFSDSSGTSNGAELHMPDASRRFSDMAFKRKLVILCFHANVVDQQIGRSATAILPPVTALATVKANQDNENDHRGDQSHVVRLTRANLLSSFRVSSTAHGVHSAHGLSGSTYSPRFSTRLFGLASCSSHP